MAGIGKGLHPDYRADLVFEDVLYAPIANLTHQERAYLALILFSSYTGRSLPTKGEGVEALLNEEARIAARSYGAAMRFAIVATGRSADLLDNFKLTVDEGRLKLSVTPSMEALLSDRVRYRLKKLGQLSGLPFDSA